MKHWAKQHYESIVASVPDWVWPTRLRVMLVLAAVFLIWGWLDVRNRGLVNPNDLGQHRTDFTVYTEAGAAFFDGRDPYAVTNPRGWKYLYPPLFALCMAPLHALQPENQLFVWYLLSLLMGWGCYSEIVRIGRSLFPDEPDRGHFGPIPFWIGYLGLAAALFPALNCLQRGQVSIFKVYLLLLGFRLLMQSRTRWGWSLAGAVLSLPIVLKITPAVPVVLLLFEQFLSALRGPRSTLVRTSACSVALAGGLAAGLIVIPSAVVGPSANVRHLQTWWNAMSRAENSLTNEDAGDSYSIRNQSLENAVCRLTGWVRYHYGGGESDDRFGKLRPGTEVGATLDRLLLVARAIVGCLLLAVTLRVARSRDPMLDAALFGIGCVVTLLVSPIARGHYFVLLLPATVFVSWWTLRCGRTSWAIVLAVLPALLTLAHYAAMNVTGRLGVLGFGTLAWYLLACVAVLRFERREAQQADLSDTGATTIKLPAPVWQRRLAA